jgi:hypothetical protein
MEGAEAPGVGVVAESCWEVCVVWHRDQVALGHSVGLHVGSAAVWEEMVVALWGEDHVVAGSFVVAAIRRGVVEWRRVYP